MVGPRDKLQRELKLQREIPDVSKLTITEATELARILEAMWGISNTEAGALSSFSDSSTDDLEGQTEFDLVLVSAGNNVINVVKEIRSITGLSVQEIKHIVRNVPQPIKLGVNRDEALRIKDQINQAGGKLDIGNSWEIYKKNAIEYKSTQSFQKDLSDNADDLTEDEWTEAIISALHIVRDSVTPPSDHVDQINKILGR